MATDRTITFTDKELITGMRNGRQDVFAAAYDKYAPVLLNFIIQITGEGELSEQVLKSVFVTAWKVIPSHSDSTTPLLTRLLTIARTAALTASVGHKQAEQIQTGRTGVGSIDKTKSKEQLVLDLMYYRGMSLEETGRAVNMEPELVRATLREAIHQLKEAAKV